MGWGGGAGCLLSPVCACALGAGGRLLSGMTGSVRCGSGTGLQVLGVRVLGAFACTLWGDVLCWAWDVCG